MEPLNLGIPTLRRHLFLGLVGVLIVAVGLSVHAPFVDSAVAATTANNAKIDVASVKVVNSKKAVSFGFTYAQAPKDLFWGGTLLFDTNPKRKGPEFGAFIDNQCGSGMTVGPVKKRGNTYVLNFAKMGPWQARCGPSSSGKCFKSYSAQRTKSGYLQRLTFRKLKGCLNPSKVRVSAEFRSNDLSNPNSKPSYDYLPGKKNAYTPWVKAGHTRKFLDRT